MPRFPAELLPLALSVLAQPLAGQQPEPLVTDRPDQTESASTVAVGYVQAEFGLTFTADSEGGVRERELAVPETLLRMGVARRLEVRLGFAGWVRNEMRSPAGTAVTSGAGDIALGAKYRLSDGQGLQPHVAVLATLTLPTAGRDLGSGTVAPTVLLIAAHSLSGRIGLGYNLGATWTRPSRPAPTVTRVDVPYSLSLGIGVARRVAGFVETYGSIALTGGRRSLHAADAGFTLRLRPGVQIDLSGGTGLNTAADDWFVGIGATVRVPR